VGTLLIQMLATVGSSPYVRRVREPWQTLLSVPGARCKRLLLSTLGQGNARSQQQAALPGNDYLAGITDPRWVHDPDFLVRWLRRMPGKNVELTCHPGHEDRSLLGRDCSPGDGQVERRVQEYQLLRDARFTAACHRAGFTLAAPAELTRLACQEKAHAA
jgi:hypothetical protein